MRILKTMVISGGLHIVNVGIAIAIRGVNQVRSHYASAAHVLQDRDAPFATLG
jgi:hypothetical protein